MNIPLVIMVGGLTLAVVLFTAFVYITDAFPKPDEQPKSDKKPTN
ncbi:hypothetical protein [Pasteurella testudinis]